MDSKLIKCRKAYPFVITTEQFLEFILPYLFLADIPSEDPNRFPNQILSAQIGVNTSYWIPTTGDVIAICFKHPEFLENENWWGPGVCAIAKTLNKERFKKIIEETGRLAEADRDKVVSHIIESIDETTKDVAEIAFIKRENLALKKRLEQESREKQEYMARSEKLRKDAEIL